MSTKQETDSDVIDRGAKGKTAVSRIACLNEPSTTLLEDLNQKFSALLKYLRAVHNYNRDYF